MLLKEEIVSRYYYQEGRAKSQLPSDSTLIKAVSVLNNLDEYHRLLTPAASQPDSNN